MDIFNDWSKHVDSKPSRHDYPVNTEGFTAYNLDRGKWEETTRDLAEEMIRLLSQIHEEIGKYHEWHDPYEAIRNIQELVGYE